MRELSVEEILEGIRQHDSVVLKYVYKSFYNQIKYLVKSNTGTDDDAQDIYQEGLIVIYRKIKQNTLDIKDCSFNTYLYSVCKLLWLKELEKKKIKQDLYTENYEVADDGDDVLEVFENSERYRLFQKHFKQLQKDCQKVIEMSLEKIPLRQIAQIMGYKSDKYAKKKKYQCKKLLVNHIKNDPKFNELK